jgi:hypothetical protein
VPRNDRTGFSPIKAAVPNAGGVIEQITVGQIARNPASVKVEAKVSALVLVITDAESRPAEPAGTSAAEPTAAPVAEPDTAGAETEAAGPTVAE